MVRTGSRRRIDQCDSDNESARPHRGSQFKRAKTEPGTGDISSSDFNSDNDDAGMDMDDYSDESEYEEPNYEEEALLAAYSDLRKSQKGYVGTASSAGIIKSISLIDFMCHRHLTVDFGPRMNFVVGHNGSGKSAVLTAIAVALGGKANLTGRGTGLKDLIRTGADRAVITITLANSGDSAYRPEVYNPNIVIERTIHSNGSSGYKFKASKDGKTIANKRSELTSISDYFNINIDSPLTILTQDQSRSFLQNADPSKLYKFFLNGTQLSSLLESYEASSQNIESLVNFIKRQREALPDLKVKVESYKRKIQASKKVMRQKRRNKQLLTELAWSYVIEKEKARDEKKSGVLELREKIDKVQEEIHKTDKELPQVNDAILETESDLKNLDESTKPLAMAVRQAKARSQEASKELRSMQSSVTEIEEKIISEKSTLERLEKKIEEQLRHNEPEQQEERRRLLQRRAKVEDILSKLKLERPARERERDDKLHAQKQAKEELQSINTNLNDLNQSKAQMQRQIQNISRQANHKVAAFGLHIDPLLQEINNTSWKHSKPIGPMGMFVHLEDMRYADVLQAMLGSALCSFAVRDHEDRVKLSNILNKHFALGYRPGNFTARDGARIPAIYRHSGELFDFSSGDLSRYGPTILSKLRKTMLAPTLVEGNRLMDDLLNKNVVQHVTVHCADLMTTSGTKSNRHSGPTNKYRGNPLFAADVGSEIAKCEAQLQDYELQRQQLCQSAAMTENRIVSLQQDMAKLSAGIADLQKKAIPLEKDLDQTKRKLADMASTEIDTSESIRDEHRADIIKQEDIIKQRDAEVVQKRAAFDAQAPTKELLLKNLESQVQRRTNILARQSHWDQSLTNYETKLEEAQDILADLEQNVQEWTDKALDYAPEKIDTTRTPAELEAERKALDQSITEASRALGVNLDELTAEYRLQRQRYQKANENIKDLNFLRIVLRKAMTNRHTWWHQTRSHIAIRAKTAFVVFESFRAMEGRLNFDHGHEKLSLVIHNQTTTESHDGTYTQVSHYKGAKALSGGERSFSTVSLLLALWSTVPCPIRALDEWDVFLDAANRKVAAKNLMEGARESDGKQYILITPLDMQGIDTSGPDKKVIRMADPERGQGTLNMS
ncbi:hypothetical protein I305_02004 [Cryptococcus gattii E566]|uniref:DNA repair-related protein, putative n=1 Tax=Cryptococcus gattii serotype B (strain WM276 / ATCC MYA-4071) TaxID=367775 RepID=E6R4H0_CRYGW|nr:DNA repair-related protein, putative [Cryptococcus gattii WM276]ADV21959.1 DNA repair-related protein, putative [Cryptococcus gattii WM276]KIY35753.1 hypothetical protein I305_02004 [Cryptococcus gattii E566]